MVLAIDIEAFTDRATYATQVEALASWVCSARPLPGVEQVYAPGEPEEAAKKQRLEEGIEIPDDTWKDLTDVAAEFGVPV
jgi:uncharacterized oxidoreductase